MVKKTTHICPRILGGVLSCDSIVRSALGVRTKKKFTTADKGRVRMTGN